MNPASLPMNLGTISKLSDAVTRSITAENPTGRKGAGGRALPGVAPVEAQALNQLEHDGSARASSELGQKWKVRPFIGIAGKATAVIADIAGPGVIQHIWITTNFQQKRDLIIRMYWDNEPTPSVEVPLGDLFCNGWNYHVPINAVPICVGASNAYNSFFPMPFRRQARITVENRAPGKCDLVAYAVNYTLGPVGDDEAYFHAQFRRSRTVADNPDHVILDGVKGEGHYVGTYMAWQQNSTGWWGEGEFKAFLDGDGEFPTICGTGTEDYFLGAWCFGATFTAPFVGYQGATDGRPGNRHNLYRFHIMDPIRFASDLRITMQALGWRGEGRYLPLQDDIASVAYWYQTEPHAPFPTLADRNALEVV